MNQPPPTLRFAFVRGYMRSGTSWIRNLLNLHPRIVCFGEINLGVVRSGVKRITTDLDWCEGAQDPAVGKELWDSFHDMVRRTLTRLARRRPAAHIAVDCTPTGLTPLLPDAPHVLLQRDGRDVLVSWTYHCLANGIAPADPDDWPTREAMLARFREDPRWFEGQPEQLLADEAWVRHIIGDWAARVTNDHRAAGQLAAPLLKVDYEHLHRNTEAARARLYTFLGVDPEQARPLDERTSPGFDRHDPSAHLRSGTIGGWRRYATPRARQIIKETAGEALILAGYEKDHNW